jgi:hypothetical protein
MGSREHYIRCSRNRGVSAVLGILEGNTDRKENHPDVVLVYAGKV